MGYWAFLYRQACERRLQEKPEAIEIAWHTRPVAETFSALETRPEGLTAQEADSRKERYGPNRLAEAKRESEIIRFLRQFHNVLIYVMIVGAVLAASIGHLADAVVIIVVVFVNATIVHPGRQGRAGAQRHPQDDRPTRHRYPRRQAQCHPRGGHRPGRPGAARAGRPRAGGSPAGAHAQSAHRRGGADRRVRSGR